jgi:ABC-2 type transport system permease protein
MPPETLKSKPESPMPPINAPRIGASMNWLGLWTLYTKEVRRFLRVGPQTLLAPVISNLLYLTVFVLAFSENRAGGADGFIAFLIMPLPIAHLL